MATSRLPPHYLVSIGFLIALARSLRLQGVFSLNTQIVEIFSATALIGVGLGLSLGPLKHLILSTGLNEQQADASGVLNTSTNLGNSLGSRLVSCSWSVSFRPGSAVEKAYPDQVTAHDVREGLPDGWRS